MIIQSLHIAIFSSIMIHALPKKKKKKRNRIWLCRIFRKKIAVPRCNTISFHSFGGQAANESDCVILTAEHFNIFSGFAINA